MCKINGFLCLQSIPNRIWKLGKLNHVAIAVPDVKEAALLYRDILGAAISEKHVSVCFSARLDFHYCVLILFNQLTFKCYSQLSDVPMGKYLVIFATETECPYGTSQQH